MKKIKDPLFYLALFLLFFWIADSWYKLFVLHTPSRLLWYSSVGLLMISIGLFRRSSLILTAMFCTLAINETIWTISFFLQIFNLPDQVQISAYAFKPSTSPIQFILTLYHLFLVPSIVLGLITLKKINRYGWVFASIFAITITSLAYLIPDSAESINCVKRMTPGSCKLYFWFLYPLDNPTRFIIATLLVTVVTYIPLNIFLLLVAKKMGWKIEPHL